MPPHDSRRRTKLAHVTITASPMQTPETPDGLGPAGSWYWDFLMDSPLASQYLDVDVPALVRLVRLVDPLDALAPGARGTGTLSMEIRQLEDRVGLSPKARRSLG